MSLAFPPNPTLNQVYQQWKWDGTAWVSAVVGGTVTSVGSGDGLSGGPITSSGAISVDATVARRNATNNFTQNQTFQGNISAPSATVSTINTAELTVGGAVVANPLPAGWRISDGALSPSFFALGYRDLPVVPITSSYTVDPAHFGKCIYITGTAAGQTLTFPNNVPIGSYFTVLSLASVGWTLLASALTWLPQGYSGIRTIAGYGIARCLCIANNYWLIWGFGIS